MEKKKKDNSDRLYTVHTAYDRKFPQGKLSMINGKRALATFKGDEIIGYTTLDEINKEFYTRKLPEYKLDF